MRRNNMEVENFKIDNRTYNILSCGRGSNKMSYNLLLQLFDILDSFDSEKQLREFIEMLKMSLYDWQIKMLFKIIREKQDVQLYGPGLGKTLLFNSLVGNGYPGRIYVDNAGCTSQDAVYFSKLKTVPSIDKRVKLYKFMDADFVLRKVLSGESESLHLSPELNEIVNGTTQLVWLTTSMGSNNFKQLYTERLAEGVNNSMKTPGCDAMMAYAHIEAVKQNIDLSSMIEQKKYERNLYEYSDYINLGKAVSQGLLDGIKDTTFTRCSDRCTFVDSMKTPDGHKLFKINGEMRNLFCSGFELKHKESIKTGEFFVHSEYPIYVDKITNSLYVLDYYGVRRDLEFISDYDNRMQVVIGDVYFMFSLRFPSSLKYTELRSFMKGKKGDYTLIDCEIGDMSEHLKNLSKFITDDVRNAGYCIEEVKLHGDILRVNGRGVRYTKCCYSNQFGSYAGKYILFETDSFGHIKVQYSNISDSYFIRYKDDVRVEFLGKTDKVDIYSVGDTGIYVHMY